MKPRLFIGSSSEAVRIATRFAGALSDVVDAVVWRDAPDFRPMHSTLDGLIESAERYDFGLFIFTPDDRITVRGEEAYSARDNVILELGLFLGALGRERTFAVAGDGDDPENKLKLIADLYGITLPRFTMPPAKTHARSVVKAAAGLHELIEAAGPRPHSIPLLRKWSFRTLKATFTATIGAAFLVQARARLSRMRIAVVCRRSNKRVNFGEDRQLAVSEWREPVFNGIDMEFKVSDPQVLGNLDDDDVVEGYIVLAPQSFAFRPRMTLDEMRADRCLIVDGGAKSESGSARRL